MNKLIRINKNKLLNCNSINARELHCFLGVGKYFSTWFKDRVNKYEFVEGYDYSVRYYDKNSDEISYSKRIFFKPYRIEYDITLDVAKELAMVQNNERGRQVRKYFIDVEKIYRARKFINYINDEFLTPILKLNRKFKTYFIFDINTGYIKIGKSFNVDERIKYFKTINPSIKLLFIITENVELKLHHEYNHKRIVGEWFNLTEIDLTKIKNYYYDRID